MALTATMYRLEVALSDVDRGVYQTLELRVARHPSESMRFMLTRTLAYCLEWEEGIAFSKGGISSTDEPPVSIRDLTGALLAWIDVGSPSAERLHKASKATPRVALYTHSDLALLRRDAHSIHRADEIAVWKLDASFLDTIEPKIDRYTKLELVRTEGSLYVTIDGKSFDGTLAREALTEN
jgi:uncharacterized protein YaeQ